jgi:hypothetical protein
MMPFAVRLRRWRGTSEDERRPRLVRDDDMVEDNDNDDVGTNDIVAWRRRRRGGDAGNEDGPYRLRPRRRDAILFAFVIISFWF